MFAPTQRIWGYESNWGSFAQFTKVQDHQCVPKPARLTWEEAAAYMLVGATAYRMLHGWPPNAIGAGDPLLIWGGAGGLGSMAIQIARAAGARPVAVVSGDAKNEFCKRLGAVGVIDRRKFELWGKLPRWSDDFEYGLWLKGARAFGAAFWEALGEKKNPTLVFEHPGETTLPTSCFMCETGGMVVICAGTTGYNATLDLRYHWMRQKRLQGSHFANDDQARGANDLVIAGKIDPCLSRVFPFAGTGECHQLMRDNQHPSGNMAILVNAPRPGLRTLADVRGAS
jgi:crotonyl-CoA carboxylase/reductase